MDKVVRYLKGILKYASDFKSIIYEGKVLLNDFIISKKKEIVLHHILLMQ